MPISKSLIKQRRPENEKIIIPHRFNLSDYEYACCGGICWFFGGCQPYTRDNQSSSMTDESSVGNISANDKAVLVPEESFEYVDFAAKIDETAEFENDSVIVSMKRGIEDANHVYTAI